MEKAREEGKEGGKSFYHQHGVKVSGVSGAVHLQWRHEDTNWLEQRTAPLRK